MVNVRHPVFKRIPSCRQSTRELPQSASRPHLARGGPNHQHRSMQSAVINGERRQDEPLVEDFITTLHLTALARNICNLLPDIRRKQR